MLGPGDSDLFRQKMIQEIYSRCGDPIPCFQTEGLHGPFQSLVKAGAAVKLRVCITQICMPPHSERVSPDPDFQCRVSRSRAR
jgi:hypothetical protein